LPVWHEVLIVGLTGGIASGKSTVSALFASQGVIVIDADEMGRELVKPGKPALPAIIARFGEDYLLSDGHLDRKRLQAHIFSHPEARRQLEQILHPMIRRNMQEQANRHRDQPYILFVIPLLVETGQHSMVDRVLLVDCHRHTQLQRLMQRDGLDNTRAAAIIASQASRHERLQWADDMICNDTEQDRQQLTARVLALHKRYLQLGSA
jgi:dephospho-CoA kinase